MQKIEMKLLKKTMRTVEDVERNLQLPVLGSILDIAPFVSKASRWEKKKNRQRFLYGLISYRSPDSLVAHNFKKLSDNISIRQSGNGDGQALVVTSPGPGEGKSTIASNLALTLAQSGKSTILVDADLKSPIQHRIFGLSNEAGLSDLLLLIGTKCEINRPRTNELALDVITCGRIKNYSVELLSSKNLENLIEKLKSQYDYVLIDTPDVLTVAEAMSIDKKIAGVVLVVQFGKTHSEAARRSRDLLENRMNILGVVLNKVNVRKEVGLFVDESFSGMR